MTNFKPEVLDSLRAMALPRRYAVMRTFVVFIVSCAALLANAEKEKPGASDVIVKVMESPLPNEERQKHKFLWEHFANKPEEQKFNLYGPKKWKDNFSLFAKSLVQKAEEQKLDSLSLAKALDLVLKDSQDHLAYLPVGAYQTTFAGKPIWIIIVKWEYASLSKSLPEGVGLGHVRMFAFDQKTLEQVGYATCS